MNPLLVDGDALLIEDVQNDFCPGGALAVADGDTVAPVINEWIAAAIEADVPVIASRDWHPEDHVSFKAQGGPWPAHCVQGTELDRRLRELGVKRLWVGGLALDYCVKASALDAMATGDLEVTLIMAATRAVNVEPGDGGGRRWPNFGRPGSG